MYRAPAQSHRNINRHTKSHASYLRLMLCACFGLVTGLGTGASAADSGASTASKSASTNHDASYSIIKPYSKAVVASSSATANSQAKQSTVKPNTQTNATKPSAPSRPAQTAASSSPKSSALKPTTAKPATAKPATTQLNQHKLLTPAPDAPTPKPSTTALRVDEVLAFVNRANELARLRDIDAYGELLAEDARFITVVDMLGESYSSVYTKTQYIEETRAGLNNTSNYSYAVRVDDVSIGKNSATVTSTVTEKVNISGMRFLSEAKEEAIIERRDGELKYVEIDGKVTMSPLTTL